MPNQTARFDGLTEGLAIKAPARVATTAAITLSGEQTIDGVAVVEGDRVLVKDQADPVANGVYRASTGPWARAKDFDGNGDVITGTRVLVTAGSANIRREFCVTTANPVIIDESEIEFEQIPVVDDAGLVTTSMTLNVGTGQTYATLQEAADYLDDKVIAADATVTIKVHGQVSTSAAVLWSVTHPQAERIALAGNSSVINATIQSSGHTVTGSADNYTVTMKLDSVAGISAGAVVQVHTPKNDSNQLFWARDLQLGTSVGNLTTVGAAMTLTSQTTDLITTGMLAIANAEAREVVGRTNATTFTLASGFTQDITNLPYWYFITKATGTAGTGGVSSVNLVGVGTDFLTRCTAGDILILVSDGVPVCRRVAAVVSDTAITLDVAVTLANGSIFAVWSHAKAHVGAFEISSVDTGDNTITYSNLMNSTRVGLGANQLKGGSVTILPDSIKNTGGSGIIYNSGALQSIDKLGIIGSNSASYTGIYSSYLRTTAHHLYLGQYVGLVGWGISIYAPMGSVLADYICIGNNVGAYAIFNDQGAVHTRYARISSSGTYCVFLGPNASHRDANAVYVGGATSVYSTAGAKRYADGAWSIGPNKVGFQAISSSGGHYVESRVLCAGSVGISGTSGSQVRFAGSIILCVGDESPPDDAGNLAGIGVSINNGLGEGSYAWASGCETRGFGFVDSSIEMTYAAACGNAGEGILNSGGRADVRFVFAAKNGGRGIYQTAGGHTNANDSWARYNTTADYAVASPGSVMSVDDFVYTSATLSQDRNTWDGGALIYDSTYLSGMIVETRIVSGYSKAGATAGWTVGGGAINTGLTATLPASQTGSTLVVPIPGLRVGDMITGFHIIGQVESAGNTVTLAANLRKMTAAAADPTDASVGSITGISVTADTLLDNTHANGVVTGLTEVVAQNETFYVLLTGTTGASTDIALQGIAVTVGS